jgi:hypothetical protein
VGLQERVFGEFARILRALASPVHLEMLRRTTGPATLRVERTPFAPIRAAAQRAEPRRRRGHRPARGRHPVSGASCDPMP